MKAGRRFSLAVVFACVLLAAARPSPGKEPAAPTGSAETAAKPADKPQIVIDEKLNAVRIFIGGKEVARIDADGVHTNQLTYTIPPAASPAAPDNTK